MVSSLNLVQRRVSCDTRGLLFAGFDKNHHLFCCADSFWLSCNTPLNFQLLPASSLPDFQLPVQCAPTNHVAGVSGCRHAAGCSHWLQHLFVRVHILHDASCSAAIVACLECSSHECSPAVLPPRSSFRRPYLSTRTPQQSKLQYSPT